MIYKSPYQLISLVMTGLLTAALETVAKMIFRITILFGLQSQWRAEKRATRSVCLPSDSCQSHVSESPLERWCSGER